MSNLINSLLGGGIGGGGLSSVNIDQINFDGNGTGESQITFKTIINDFNFETKVMDNFPNNLGRAVFYEYYITNGINSRAGTIIGNWANYVDNVIEFVETTTADIGNTEGISFTLTNISNIISLTVNSSQTGSGYTFKSTRRIIN